MNFKTVKLNKDFIAVSGFGNVFICENASHDDKTITFPNGYNSELNISFKVVFVNGHSKANDSSHMTLNNVPVVVNRYGTLIPIPNHNITGTVYETLQPYTTLEMYYTNNYDGNDNPAFVVVGNPVVLSSADYTIYADGKIKHAYEYRLEVESGGADDPTQQTQSTYNYEIGSNYGINVGDVIKITFVQELQSSVPITTVNLSCGGKNGAIVVRQADTTVTNQPTAEYKWIASHVFNGGNYSSTYNNKVWDANTTLELTWTGSYWLVMNNPIVCSYTSTSASYNIYASGLIEQYFDIVASHDTTEFNWIIEFESKCYVKITFVNSATREWSPQLSSYTNTTCKCYTPVSTSRVQGMVAGY